MSLSFLNALHDHPQPISSEAASALYQTMPDSYQHWVAEHVFMDFFCSKERSSIYWHDYEAGGTDPALDTPLQHAGIRTDLELRIIDEPNDWYCLLSGDRLPHPQALLLTKISLKKVAEAGLAEPLFFRNIFQEMSVPMTCSAGFNSLKYDDEMTRFGFYRSLLPVYEREFLNGNSRWDLLPLTAAIAAWDPEHYIWPVSPETGERSLKLELLAKSNSITQENAHNAVDDVLATILWARCIKTKSPVLYEYFFARRNKGAISKDLVTGALGMYASPMHAKQGYAVPVLVLGQPYGNDKNKFVLLDLSNTESIRNLWRAARQGPDAIRELLFVKKEVLLASGAERLPLLTVALNKCPMFIRHDHPAASGVNWLSFQKIIEAMQAQTDEAAYIRRTIFTALSSDENNGHIAMAEVALYQGFPDRSDQQNIKVLTSMSAAEAFGQPMQWKDPKYATLWQAAKCRLLHSGGALDHASREAWNEHCRERVRTPLQRSDKHAVVHSGNIKEQLQALDAWHLKEEYEIFWPTLFSPDEIAQPAQ